MSLNTFAFSFKKVVLSHNTGSLLISRLCYELFVQQITIADVLAVCSIISFAYDPCARIISLLVPVKSA